MKFTDHFLNVCVGDVIDLDRARIRREYSEHGLRIVGGTLHQRRPSLISQLARQRVPAPSGGDAA